MSNAMRYDCSLLRRHNWKKETPYGWAWKTKYWKRDTINHLLKWIKTGNYDWWKYWNKEEQK